MIKKGPIKPQGKKLSVDISLEELLEAGCHFGHSVSKIHPQMREYVYMARQGVHIFDLVKGGGKVIFVGTKRQAAPIIEKKVKGTGMFYIRKHWVGGLLTNWSEVKKNLEKLIDLRGEVSRERKGRTKYEQALLKRECSRLEELYGGIDGLTDIPQALFVVDVKRKKTAILEAEKMGIPVVAIVDTNSNPSGVDYIIPANDDAKGSISYIIGKIVEVIRGDNKEAQK